MSEVESADCGIETVRMRRKTGRGRGGEIRYCVLYSVDLHIPIFISTER